MLRVFLGAEVLAVVALLMADTTAAAIVRSWFRPIVVTTEQVQAVITVLAIASVVGVAVEAVRKGRFSPRRNGEGLKVASA